MQMMETRGDWGTLVCGFYPQTSLWLSRLSVSAESGDFEASEEEEAGGYSLESGPRREVGLQSRLVSEEGTDPLRAVWGQSWSCTLFGAPR